MKTDLLQSCGHCWVFQICWHLECSTFTASSFRIWNSSTGIPSPPLALFIVMLSKAHLISHSMMSGSRWVITPSWLSRLWRSILHSSSMYSSHLFFIYSAPIRSITFLSFRVFHEIAIPQSGLLSQVSSFRAFRPRVLILSNAAHASQPLLSSGRCKCLGCCSAGSCR